MKIEQTISQVTMVDITNSVGSSIAVKIFAGVELKNSSVVNIANTHASQDLYVKWVNRKDHAGTVAISSTDFYVKIASGEDRQFQFRTEESNPNAGQELWVLGSGSSTTYTAVAMK